MLISISSSGELGGGVRIEHCRAVRRQLSAASTSEALDIDLGLHQCGQMARMRPDGLRDDAVEQHGIVRSARTMPPTPSVSPIVWRSL
jgi:hypothetical protein